MRRASAGRSCNSRHRCLMPWGDPNHPSPSSCGALQQGMQCSGGTAMFSIIQTPGTVWEPETSGQSQQRNEFVRQLNVLQVLSELLSKRRASCPAPPKFISPRVLLSSKMHRLSPGTPGLPRVTPHISRHRFKPLQPYKACSWRSTWVLGTAVAHPDQMRSTCRWTPKCGLPMCFPPSCPLLPIPGDRGYV